MGQKVHPTGIRLGITERARSTWYMPKKKFADTLHSDIKVRDLVMNQLLPKAAAATIARIDISRTRTATVTLHTARPGTVIGRKGEDIEKLRQELSLIMGMPVRVNIEEIRKPELSAQLVAVNIADQLKKRVMFRRAMKRAVSNAMRLGAKGIKICVSGRLGGAEIARREWVREGRIPLHTFRADIDYGLAEALTTYGIIGVKVWIFKGEVLDKEQSKERVSE